MSCHVVRPDAHSELHVESLGADDGAPLLLLGGGTWSKDWWDDELCAAWVAAGFRVIRFDPRDTGESTSYPVGEPGYTGDDLVGDAIAVLDGLGVARAHVAGLSMGGGLAQALACTHGDRVATLTLMSTSPADPAVDGLPGPTPALAEVLGADDPGPDWTDRAAVIEYLVDAERPFAGPGCFEEDLVRRAVTRSVARTRDPASALTNHFLVGGDIGAVTSAVLGARPVLVIHGTADPLFPVEHGRALAASIPGARLLELDGVGHQLPPRRTWAAVVDAMSELRAAAG